ncbi:MAG: DUF669 domain-containing protein [Clostridiales bacterium]|nr:DUF669 domain-containing protein [Clostridiales bacterium]
MEYQSNNGYQQPANDGCLGWDDEIQREDSYTLLDEGDYAFTVTKVERARYNPKPGGKIPACNQATVSFQVGPTGEVMTENFLLHTRMEWKISALYAAIGMKQQGERVRMNWPAVIGRSGYCHVTVREYKKDDGSTGKSNSISKYYAPWDPEYANLQAAQQQPTQQYIPQQQPQQTSMYSTAPNQWTPGKF